MRPLRYVLADWRQAWWGLILLVPMLIGFAVCLVVFGPLLWLYEVISDWLLDLLDVPERGGRAHVDLPYASYAKTNMVLPDGHRVAWGIPALKRRNLRAWCREKGVPFDQCEVNVKAHFAEMERKKKLLRRYWAAGGGRVMHEDSPEALELLRECEGLWR